MRRFVLLLAAALLVAGCAEYKQIKVDSVSIGSFRFNGTSSAVIELAADVDNPTRHTLYVESVDAVLLREGREFVLFSLQDTVSSGAGTRDVVMIPVKASVVDPISIITSGLDFSTWDMNLFTVEGKVVLKTDSGVKKTLRLRNVQLRELVNMFK